MASWAESGAYDDRLPDWFEERGHKTYTNSEVFYTFSGLSMQEIGDPLSAQILVKPLPRFGRAPSQLQRHMVPANVRVERGTQLEDVVFATNVTPCRDRNAPDHISGCCRCTI